MNDFELAGESYSKDALRQNLALPEWALKTSRSSICQRGRTHSALTEVTPVLVAGILKCVIWLLSIASNRSQ
jgi:hypothetical protein